MHAEPEMASVGVDLVSQVRVGGLEVEAGLLEVDAVVDEDVVEGHGELAAVVGHADGVDQRGFDERLADGEGGQLPVVHVGNLQGG